MFMISYQGLIKRRKFRITKSWNNSIFYGNSLKVATKNQRILIKIILKEWERLI